MVDAASYSVLPNKRVAPIKRVGLEMLPNKRVQWNFHIFSLMRAFQPLFR